MTPPVPGPGPAGDRTTPRGLVGLVGLEAIRTAAAGLAGIVMRTPVVELGGSERSLWLKAESLQSIGAFKIRGACNALASLSAEERARGAVTYSSGNHGRGVARAARLLGIPAIVVIPTDAPAVKVRAIAADGAEIVAAGTSGDERRAVAERIAAERGMALVPPFDDDRIIAGQGTIGLELLDQLPDLSAVVIPIGGGGLASGISAAIRALRRNVRLIGVEPEFAADARDSLAAGRIVAWPASATARTIADGARTTALGRRTFAHLSALLDSIVTVSEPEIAAGIRLAAEQARLVVEPTGALAVAALAFRARELGIDGRTGPVVGIVSGGNVDPERYREWLAAPIPDWR
ncbi:MAG TPA: threonine/serine dehydratase [Candidatus Saccharimonadales bacterium]|nr:threonine/serine dehydratase [Candidatus Saccharimonadales bacterium]